MDLGPWIPFPRLLLRFLSTLFPFVAAGFNDYTTSNTTSNATSNPSSNTASKPSVSSPAAYNTDSEKVLWKSTGDICCDSAGSDPPKLFSAPKGLKTSPIKKENKSPKFVKVGTRFLSEFERLRNLFPELPAAYSVHVEREISAVKKMSEKEEIYSQDSAREKVDLGSESSQDSRYDGDRSKIREKGVENDVEKEVEVQNSLRIGYTELWLGCLKTLVSLTHNCAAASDILMQSSTGTGVGAGKGNGTERGAGWGVDKGTPASNNKGSSSSNSKRSHTDTADKNNHTDSRGERPEIRQNNVMSVCCAALSICISRRNAAEERTKISSTNSERTVRTAPGLGGGPEKGIGSSLGGTLSPGETAEEVRARTQ
jgi:hypothetical protein